MSQKHSNKGGKLINVVHLIATSCFLIFSDRISVFQICTLYIYRHPEVETLLTKYEDKRNDVTPRQRSSTKKTALAMHKTSGSGSFLAHLNDIINMAEMSSSVLHCCCPTFSCKCLTLSFNLSCVGLVTGPQTCSSSGC